MISKQSFNLITKKYKENGLIKEVYSTDDFIVCNIANYWYAMFLNTKGNAAFGLAISSKALEALTTYPDFYKNVIAALEEQNMLERSLIVLNDKNYEKVRGLKQKTDISGPSPNVNIDLEKRIIEENMKGKGGFQL